MPILPPPPVLSAPPVPPSTLAITFPAGLVSGNLSVAYYGEAAAFGHRVNVYGKFAIGIGYAVRVYGDRSVVIGNRSRDGALGGTGDVLVGYGTQTNTVDGKAIAVGEFARADAWRSIAVGANSIAEAVSASGFGYGTRASHLHTFAASRGAQTDRPNSVVLGSSGTGPFYAFFDMSHSRTWYDYPSGDKCLHVPTESPIYVQGISAKDEIVEKLPDGDGGDIWLLGGPGTGTGKGGKAGLAVTLPGAESGYTENAIFYAAWANERGNVQIARGVEAVSADGYHWRYFIDNAGDWHKELLSAPEPEEMP